MAAIRPMRIVSGSHKGKRIVAPGNLPVRPTTDFAKESLFNILSNHYHLSGLHVLDLYSGTGNMAYEFASRGAASVVSVDQHTGCVRFINKTAQQLNMPIETFRSDAEKFLSKAASGSYDIIFADPPYDVDKETLETLAMEVFNRQLLKEEGCLVLEHHSKIDLSGLPHFTEARKYGNAIFSFFFLSED